MDSTYRLRPVMGALVWAALALGAFLAPWPANQPKTAPEYPAGKVWTYLVSRPFRVQAVFPAGTPAFRGDPVCLRRDGRLSTVGQIREVRMETERTTILVEFFEPLPDGLTGETRFIAVPNPRTPAWVIDVLLPEARRERLLQDLREFSLDHREEIYETFWGPFEGFLKDSFRILQEDLPRILAERDDEIQRLLERHKKETFEPELMPVLKEEVWPLLEKRSEPLLDKVGDELLAEVPLFDLGWGQVKDWAPFWGKDNVRFVLREFIRQKATPVLREHTEDFLALSREVMIDITKNPRVTDVLRKSVIALAGDPEFIRILRDVFTDLVSPEGRIFQAFRDRFSDPAFVDRLNRLFEALGPMLNRTANSILLDGEGGGINPDLIRVLRTQILWKDASWIWVEPAGGPPVASGHVFKGELYSWKQARDVLNPSGSERR